MSAIKLFWLVVAIFSLTTCLTCAVAAIWSSGQIVDRLAGTAMLSFIVGFVASMIYDFAD